MSSILRLSPRAIQPYRSRVTKRALTTPITMRTMADQRIPVAPAEILAQRTYLAPGKLEITEHTFRVPLDHHSPTSGTIRLFARTTRRPPAARPDPSSASTSAPAPPEKYMVWLNGGPGQSSALPQDYAFTAPLLERGYTLLTLDQRGTGLSTPLTPETLPLHGAVAAQVACLKLHRADSIVRDCEAVRAALFPSQESKWALFGQSFGGFVALSYLSFYPQALSEVFIFGGLAPVACSEPGEVYARLYRRVERRNAAFYAKFPEDVGRVRRVVAALQEGKGGTLTARRFMQLGLLFGFHGRFDRVHDIVLRATTDLDAFGFLTRNTLAVVDAVFAWDECLLYSILHEAIYCQGQQAAANWAAHRLAEHDPRFTHFGQRRLHLPTGPEEPVSTDDESAAATPPLLFTGEMIYPWMFDDCAGLAGVREAAHGLARETDWPPLYDLQQLARNEVPVYAAVYGEDMYVDHDLSMDTAARVKGCKVFATNVWYHNAIRDKCKEVLEQLFALRDDVID